MRKFLLPMLGLVGLSACAAVDPYASYSGKVSPAAASAVSDDVAGYVVTVIPPGHSTIWVRPSRDAKSMTGLVLENALRRRGFAVAPDDAGRPVGAHELRYLIEPDGQGATARIVLDGRTVSRWYGIDQSGHVVPAGPFTVFDVMTGAENG